MTHEIDLNSPEFLSTRARITDERVHDLNGYFTESFSELSDKNKTEIMNAVLDGANMLAGDLLIDAVYRWCSPTDEEVMEAIK